MQALTISSIVASASVVLVVTPSVAEFEGSTDGETVRFTNIGSLKALALSNHLKSGSHCIFMAAYSISNNCC